VQLLTPRPTPVPATATPVRVVTPRATQQKVATPSPTPSPTLRGTPVAASEPLQGFLIDDRLTSPIIGEELPYRVYLPPDYAANPDRRYPVLYMLHGAGGNYTEWSDSFLPERADELIRAGEIQPMIVVMPEGGERSYFSNLTDGRRWGDYLSYEVVPFIDAMYRTVPTRASRAIGGLSSGGLGALQLALNHPDLFGVVGGHSPSVRLEPEPALWYLSGQSFYEQSPLWLAQNRPWPDGLRVWLDVGTDDWWRPNVEVLHDTLEAQGHTVRWAVFAGTHEAEYWIGHVPDYLRFYSGALNGEPSTAVN
jgi:enterochelin esterase-like enzyme